MLSSCSLKSRCGRLLQLSTISPVAFSIYTWFVPKVIKTVSKVSVLRSIVCSIEAGLYITPNGFTMVRNFQSINFAPILLAKHEPTNSTRSQGNSSKRGLGTFTIVLNSIFTKVLLFVQKSKSFINVFRKLL